MLFHTWTFAIFFIVVYTGYLAVRRTRLQNPWLLLASYVFYGWWNPLYLILIVRCTVMDWGLVVFMGRAKTPGRRRLWLVLSIATNLAVLAAFKYAGHVVANINYVLASSGWTYTVPQPTWLLPVGISFFTFQSMSYVIDYYRGKVRFEPDIVRYATFVALFPQLVAGPIERAANLLPQLRRPDKITAAGVSEGLSMFVVGLFKKVALADFLGVYVDSIYDMPEQFGAPALILATVAFGWQIYFDFSGYTDMARGVARMMGFRLMFNFNNPYLAVSLRDFWRRWHISLSTWFRDYVYIPLGGSRGGEAATYRNLLATMLICGLWHGATWPFLIWGALHAAGAALTRELDHTHFYAKRLPKIVKQALVFAFVTFAWIFFRAADLTDALIVVRRIFTGGWADPGFPLLAAGLVAAVWVYQFMYESRARRILELAPVRVALIVFMLLYLAFVPGAKQQPFIYFQF